jgi:2-methylcitrate dehydratase PrpD
VIPEVFGLNVTDAVLDFAFKYNDYENLPQEVVHEIKRTLLDGIGNALGGIASDKGKIGVQMARIQGGRPEATLIGIGGKYPASIAAFANAELLNGLDMDPIPHIPPVVLPPVLAVSEAERLSGKQLISALAVAQEIALRFNHIFGMVMINSLVKHNRTPDVFSNGNETILGAAVGNAVAMGLDRERVAHALGISAYYCTLPVCRDWESTCPKSMIKYAPVSWLAQGSVQAAMLARAGYTGNENTLDGEYGFPRYATQDSSIWQPEKITEGLGEHWRVLNYNYKPYPCCRFIHSVLDCFYRILDKYRLAPSEIESVDCHTGPFHAHPDQYAVSNQIDAQFSMPYCMALAAHDYKPGPAWQSKRALGDPRIREFMHKVRMHVAPEYAEWRRKDFNSWYGRVEVKARGQVFSEETYYPGGCQVEGYKFTDEKMIDRFKVCAYEILTDEKVDRAVDAIMNVEALEDLDDLSDNISL